MTKKKKRTDVFLKCACGREMICTHPCYWRKEFNQWFKLIQLDKKPTKVDVPYYQSVGSKEYLRKRKQNFFLGTFLCNKCKNKKKK